MSYIIRSMVEDDLPIVRKWLAAPHVQEWWLDSNSIEFVSGDLGHSDVAQFIIVHERISFAYLQCYQLSEWDSGYGLQPKESRGVDLFIGERAFLNAGHGSAFLRQFGDSLFDQGVPKLFTDPSPENLRAIAAYRKAGFEAVHEITTPDGAALMMERNP